jgi:hypothetical protein
MQKSTIRIVAVVIILVGGGGGCIIRQSLQHSAESAAKLAPPQATKPASPTGDGTTTEVKKMDTGTAPSSVDGSAGQPAGGAASDAKKPAPATAPATTPPVAAGTTDGVLMGAAPADKAELTPAEAKGAITFRWTALTPKPAEPVTYRLKVWQLMQGQSGSQAMRSNRPIVTKDVDNVTQAMVSGIYTGPCRPPYLCDFVWSVEALSGTGVQGVQSNPHSFSVTAEAATDTGAAGSAGGTP